MLALGIVIVLVTRPAARRKDLGRARSRSGAQGGPRFAEPVDQRVDRGDSLGSDGVDGRLRRIFRRYN